MKRLSRGLLAVGIAALVAGSGSASQAGEGELASAWVPLHEGSRVRLIAAPGAKVNVAVEVQLAPGWKTYWRMPGDAGVPPQFDWKASENAERVQVLYPAPHRLIEPAAETIGYKGAVVFPVEVAAKDRSKPIGVKVELELGICKEICVPAEATLALDLPARSAAGPLPGQLAEALASVPKPAGEATAKSPIVLRTDAQLSGSEPKLVIEARFPGDAAASDIFIEAPDSLYVPMTKRVGQTADGGLRFEARLSPATAKDLKGQPLTLTLVGAEGATEARWTLP